MFRGICSTKQYRTPELRPELRTKLAPLLQALLMEAAKAQRRGCEPDLQIEEGGDDEDHA